MKERKRRSVLRSARADGDGMRRPPVDTYKSVTGSWVLLFQLKKGGVAKANKDLLRARTFSEPSDTSFRKPVWKQCSGASPEKKNVWQSPKSKVEAPIPHTKKSLLLQNLYPRPTCLYSEIFTVVRL